MGSMPLRIRIISVAENKKKKGAAVEKNNNHRKIGGIK
jgi:hypothetical protein